MGWGSGSIASCENLVKKAEENAITEIVILPLKKLKDEDIIRICKSKSLRTLSCSGHKLSASTLEHVGQTLANGSFQITSLAIGDSTMGDEGAKALCSAGSFGSLESLDLSNKQMSEDGTNAVFRTAQASLNLSSLDLSRNPIDTASLEAPLLPKITNLNLSDIKGIRMDFFTNMASIETLNLSRTPVSSIEGLPSTVKHLQLSGCSLEGNFFLKSQSLQSLDISRNSSITSVDLDCPNLQELTVQGCQSIQDWSFLESKTWESLLLDISETKCPLLKLRSLHLRAFECGLDLNQKVLLEDTAVLETLDVAGNKSKVSGLLQSILNDDGTFPVLKTLVIGGNLLDEEAEALLRQLKEKRPSLDIARDK